MREGEDPDLAHHVFVPPSALILGEPAAAGERCPAPCFHTRSPIPHSLFMQCVIFAWRYTGVAACISSPFATTIQEA